MNAYELAKAQQAYSPPTLEEIIKQQADRIAELEKQVQGYQTATKHYREKSQIKELSDEEIEVLKEIIRISDRKHPLWDKAKEFLK